MATGKLPSPHRQRATSLPPLPTRRRAPPPALLAVVATMLHLHERFHPHDNRPLVIGALGNSRSPLALAPMYRGFTLLRLPSTASAF